MAILKNWDLSFEFIFRELDECLWVQYEIYFRWQGESIVRDDLLKRSPSGWAGRAEGSFRANEYDGDSFLPVLERVLETNQAEYWKPTEPDVIIGLYPDRYFPLIPSKNKIVYEAECVKGERIKREERKKENNGRLPDDTITMIVMIDSYNWQGCGAYEGQGPALILAPSRETMESFRDELQAEWKAFKRDQRLEERLKERDDSYGQDEG